MLLIFDDISHKLFVGKLITCRLENVIYFPRNKLHKKPKRGPFYK